MINDLYTPIKGSPHVVKVVNVLREFTKGEKMENTAITQQVLAQRQKFYNFGKETLNEDDLNFEPFSMELELFLEEYETLTEANEKKSKMKTGIKMRVTPEQNVKVQIITSWNGKHKKEYVIEELIEFPCIFIDKCLNRGFVDKAFFEEYEYEEVDPELFIRTNGTCEEGSLCGAEELKTIKHVLQDMEAPQEEQANQVRKYNIGSSDYAKRKIQPWDIWLEYELNPWDADIVKRVLRNKQGQSRIEEYQKIIHICEERIRQIANTPQTKNTGGTTRLTMDEAIDELLEIALKGDNNG